MTTATPGPATVAAPGAPAARPAARPTAGRRLDAAWIVGAVALALLLMLPLAAIVGRALEPAGAVWEHLAATVLPRYVGSTLWLLLGVGVGVAAGGVGTAWLVSLCRFPGRGVFEWALLLPLAMPAYVVAYVYAGVLDAAGPVHGALRAWLGADGPLPWFPNVRSLPGAAVVLTLVLYPYVYMLARAAFLEQSVCVLEVSRTLGRTPWGAMWSVALPLARPSIAVGVALALMETLNDFGAVQHFGVDTFTTGIFRTWLGRNEVNAAAQLAVLLVLFVVVLVALERVSRGQAAYRHMSVRYRPLPEYRLGGWRAAAAFAFCLGPILFGFLLPTGLLAAWTIETGHAAIDARFVRLAANSFVLAGAAALVCVALGAALAYLLRRRPTRGLRLVVAAANLGYAIPGAVVAVGVVLALAGLDRLIFGGGTGLVLSGGVFALLFAYTVRFLPIGVGTVESGLTRVTPHMDDAARTLGCGPGAVLRRVHGPMLRGSLLTAGVLVFVDVMKELPATLMIRPLNFDTLAIRTYEFASDEQLALAAPSALAIVAVGVLPVLLLSRAIARARPGADPALQRAAS